MLQILTVFLTLSVFIAYSHAADCNPGTLDKQSNSPRCQACCPSLKVQTVQKIITAMLSSFPKELKSAHFDYWFDLGMPWKVHLFAKGILTLNTHVYGYFCCNLEEKCPVCHSLVVKAINERAILQELETRPIPSIDMIAQIPKKEGVCTLNGQTATVRVGRTVEIQLTSNIKIEWSSQDRCSGCKRDHFLYTITINEQSYFLECLDLLDLTVRDS